MLFAGRFFFEVVEDGEGFFGDVPLAKDLVDDAGGKTCGYQAAHHAGRVLRTLRFWKAFSAEVLAGEGLLVGVGIAGFDGVGNNLAGDAFLGKVLADAALAEFLILLAEARVDFGVGCVVEIAVLFESSDGVCDDGISAIAGFYALAHEPVEFGLGTHVAAKGLDGVIVEAGFVEVRLGFHVCDQCS